MVANANAIQVIESRLELTRDFSYFSAALSVAGKVSSYFPLGRLFSPLLEKVGAVGLVASAVFHRVTVTHLIGANVAHDEHMVNKTAKAIKEMIIPIGISVICNGINTSSFPLLFAAALFSHLSFESLIDNHIMAKLTRGL